MTDQPTTEAKHAATLEAYMSDAERHYAASLPKRPHRKRHPGYSIFETDKRARDARKLAWGAVVVSLLAVGMCLALAFGWWR